LFWNTAIEETTGISAFADFCKRVRFRQSDCRTCQEICPDDAISFNPGPTISSSCTACGLCVNACPTEVFRDESSAGLVLLQQAQSLLSKVQAPGQEKTLLIHCHRADRPAEDSLFTPCLGTVNENLILDAALSGFHEVVLTKGICSRCRYAQGEKLLQDSVTASRLLLESLGQKEFEIRIEEKEKTRTFVRRGVFSTLTRGVRAIQQSAPGRSASESGSSQSSRRTLLGRILRQKDWGDAAVAEHKTECRWARISIDERKCTACGICAKVCPAGAIDMRQDHEHQLLLFSSALCNNCRLCVEACPENAIDLEGGLTLKAMIEKKSDVVARVPMCSCVMCGQSIPAWGRPFCPTCEKRQLSLPQLASQRKRDKQQRERMIQEDDSSEPARR